VGRGGGDYSASPDAAPGSWGFSLGKKKPTVTVLEISWKDNDVYARWYEGKNKRMLKLLDTVRDADGDIDMDLHVEAATLGRRVYQILRAGGDPREELNRKAGAGGGGRYVSTVDEGLRRFMDKKSGNYAAQLAAGDERTYKNREAHVRYLRRFLPAGLTWSNLTHAQVKGVWVAMAKENAKDSSQFGDRVAEQTVGCVYVCRRWLLRNGALRASDLPPIADDWRQELKADWTRITGQSTRPSRPPYGQTELELILGAASAAREDGTYRFDMDPRFRLLLELAPGLRLGAVAKRTKRSGLDLSEGAGSLGHGRLTTPGAGKKHGVVFDLRDADADRVRAALTTGYLADLEVAYRAGKIRDYNLWPAHRLRGGRAQVRHADTSVGSRFLRGQLRALEDAIYAEAPGLDVWSDEQHEAKSMHIRGRGWHGLRRALTVAMKKAGVSPEAINAAMGWAPGSRMQDTIYDQREEDERIAMGSEGRAAALRAVLGADAAGAEMPREGGV